MSPRASNAVFWVPAYLACVAITFALKPGVKSESVHWAESLAFASAYPALSFAAGYWAVKKLAPTARPIWRITGALAAFSLQFWAGIRS